MYNEMLFFLHIIVLSCAVLWALRYSYGALMAVLSLHIILANLFVTKQIVLFGVDTTCSEVFIVSSMYGIGLIRSYYGVHAARNALWTTFGFLVFFTLLTQFHCAYSGIDPIVSAAITGLCSSTVRLLVAGFLAYMLSERVHLWVAQFFGARHASIIAQIFAIAAGQFVDTITFAWLGLYGLVADLSSVILFCLIIKGVILLVLSPLLALTYRYAQCRHGRQHNSLKGSV